MLAPFKKRQAPLLTHSTGAHHPPPKPPKQCARALSPHPPPAQFPMCDGAHVAHNKETGDNVGPLIVEKDV